MRKGILIKYFDFNEIDPLELSHIKIYILTLNFIDSTLAAVKKLQNLCRDTNDRALLRIKRAQVAVGAPQDRHDS